MNVPARPTMLAAIVKHYRRILRDTLVVSALIYGATFLIPNKFSAATVIMPPAYDSDLAGLISTVPGAMELSRVIGLDTHSSVDVYVGVLRSATINGKLVKRFGLEKVYKAKDYEKAGKKLTQHTGITLTNEGFIRLAVTERDKVLAADLANAYVEELDLFLRTNTNTGARQRREFLETRLAETRTALVQAENELRDYQVQKRLPSVGADVQRSAEAAAGLVAEKVEREVELGTLMSVSRATNPRAEELRNEIRQIDSELMKIPPATTGLARLYRSVRMQERILLVLAEENERARVLELKNIPTVDVVDRAAPPLHKSFPRRGLVAAASLVIVFATSSVLWWARDGALQAA